MTKLEAALDLAAKGFRVFPLAENTKVPIKGFTDFSRNASSDPERVRAMFYGHNHNIGISTDEWCVIDVDVKNPKKNGMETIKKLNAEGKYFSPTFTQVTATGGLHLFYKTPYPVRNSAGKIGPGIDTRGMSGYVVGNASVIDGVKYSYKDGAFADLPAFALEALEEAREEKPKHLKLVVPVNLERAIAQAKKYLSGVETEAGERNVEGYKVANKLKDLGLPENEVFLTMMEDWNCSPPLDLAELKAVVHSAFRYGKEGQGSASPEAMFREPVTQSSQSLPDEGHPVQNLNKEYAFVLAGGRHHILHETTDHRGKFEVQHIQEESFHKSLQSLKHHLDGGRTIPLTKYWMDSPQRRTYFGLIFDPANTIDKRYYNLWRGFGIEELKENEKVNQEAHDALHLFKEHLLDNICDGDLDHFKWVLAWFSHLVQRPWEKPDTALVLRGRKGVGKNIVMDIIGRFFPQNYLVVANRRYMTGNFNSHLANKLLLVFDEAFWSGDKEADAILKDLITGKKTQIEQKGKDSFSVDSCLRVAILGNEEWVVPASHEERRYAIFDVKDGRRQDRKFFGAMMKGMENGGDRLLFTYLRNFDLSGIDVKIAPQTEGLLRQKEQSLNPLEQWWLDSLYQGSIDYLQGDFESGEWPTRVEKSALINAFNFYARKRNITSRNPKDMDTVQSLQKFTPEIVSAFHDDSKVLMVTIPSLEECRRSWDEHQGQKHKWIKR